MSILDVFADFFRLLSVQVPPTVRAEAYEHFNDETILMESAAAKHVKQSLEVAKMQVETSRPVEEKIRDGKADAAKRYSRASTSGCRITAGNAAVSRVSNCGENSYASSPLQPLASNGSIDASNQPKRKKLFNPSKHRRPSGHLVTLEDML